MICTCGHEEREHDEAGACLLACGCAEYRGQEDET